MILPYVDVCGKCIGYKYWGMWQLYAWNDLHTPQFGGGSQLCLSSQYIWNVKNCLYFKVIYVECQNINQGQTNLPLWDPKTFIILLDKQGGLVFTKHFPKFLCHLTNPQKNSEFLGIYWYTSCTSYVGNWSVCQSAC